MLETVDELVPAAADRVRRCLAGVLEQLDTEHGVTPKADRISRLAITKTGVLMTSSDSAVITRSLSRYCRIAPHAPTTTPTTVPITEPMTSSRRLTPMRRHSSSVTGCPPTVVPKSPRTTPDAQSP